MAADEAAAEDGVRLALDDEVEQLRVLLGAVLEVGVLDDDDVAHGRGDAAAHGGPLPAVPFLDEVREAAAGGQRLDDVAAAVRGGVVDRDQLEAQGHGQDAIDDLLDGPPLVVDGHHDGEERILEGCGPAAAHGRDPSPAGRPQRPP